MHATTKHTIFFRTSYFTEHRSVIRENCGILSLSSVTNVLIANIKMERQEKTPISSNSVEESHLPSGGAGGGLSSVAQRENFPDNPPVLIVSQCNARVEPSTTNKPASNIHERRSIMSRMKDFSFGRSSFLSFHFGPGSLHESKRNGQTEERIEDKFCSKMYKLVFS